MKTIRHNKRSKDHLLHIETDLGIINIRVGLTDMDGREVESISFKPDNYAGEVPVVLDGYSNTRFIRGGVEKDAEKTTPSKGVLLDILSRLLDEANMMARYEDCDISVLDEAKRIIEESK